MEDAQMLGRTSRDSDARFVQMFRDHRGELYGYVCRLVGDTKQAEDLVQDTFVKAYRAVGRLPEEANARAWLYRIATNTATDWLRRRRLIAWLPLFEHDQREACRTAFADETLEGIAVQRALAQLPHRYRVPLVLFVCQGCSTQEIAQILRISRGAVKTRLFRAREKFRKLYLGGEVKQ